MKKSVFSIIIKVITISFIVVTPLIANLPQETSLQSNLFPSINGNAKIDSLNNYAFNLEKSDLELRMALGKQCYKSSILNNYTLGLTQSLNNIGFSFYLKREPDSALSYFKTAFYYANKIQNHKWKTLTSINIAEVFSKEHQLDSSLIYYRRGLANAVQAKDSVSIPKIFNLIGITYWRKGQFNQAITYYKESLKIQRKLNDTFQTTKIINNIGSAYFNLRNYELALNYYIDAFEMRKNISRAISPVFLNNIGLVYLELKDTSNARRYFSRALEEAEKTKNVLGKGYSYLNFGDLFFQIGEYYVALEYYNKALLFYKELDDLNATTKIANRIGEVYFKTNRPELAKMKFLEAYKISRERGLKLTQTESLINYCKTSILKGNYRGVISNLEKAYKLAVAGGFVENVLEVLRLQSEVHENLQDYKTAVLFHHKYNSLKDSLFNENSFRILSDTKEKYETTKKEERNNELQQKNEIQILELENQKREKLYIIALSILSFFVIIYLTYLSILRKKRNLALHKAKMDVELINSKLKETNELLHQSNSTKDKFFSIISHDLKNPFNTLLGATEILQSDFDEMSSEENKELINIIANDSQKLYSLLENLLYWANSQTGNLKADRTSILLHQLVSETVTLFGSSAKEKEITIEINIPKSLIIVFDKFMFSTIIRNLLSNAIKFTQSGGKILCDAKELNDVIIFKVVDSGIGIEKKNIDKLFDESSNYRELGTNKEKGTGLGLILCRDFAKENSSKISVTSEVGKGSTFELIIEKGE